MSYKQVLAQQVVGGPEALGNELDFYKKKIYIV